VPWTILPVLGFVNRATTARAIEALSSPPPEPIFLATVRWLSHEKIVTIAPRAPQERTLTMDGAQRKMLMIFFAVVLLPGLAAAVAASIRIRA